MELKNEAGFGGLDVIMIMLMTFLLFGVALLIAT
jgi:hypothetical protein